MTFSNVPVSCFCGLRNVAGEEMIYKEGDEEPRPCLGEEIEELSFAFQENMPPKDTKPTNESAAQIKQSLPDYGLEPNRKSKEAHVGNKNYGVGGTA